MSRALTAGRAAAHEALVVKMLRLSRQVETVAARRPEEPVSETVARIAADLLFEAARFEPGASGLPQPAPDYSGLAAQLGQALAALEAFEVRHTVWDARQKGFAWRIVDGPAFPIARLRQPRADAPNPRRESHDHRERLNRLLNAKFAERYEAGFAAGQATQDEPPSSSPTRAGGGGRGGARPCHTPLSPCGRESSYLDLAAPSLSQLNP